MGWKKRDPAANLMVLGDDEGNVRAVGGLLWAVKQDPAYPGRHNYEVVTADGEVVTLAGGASLSRQIFPSDVGKFFKAQFQGWGKSPKGRFKQIEVIFWDDEEPTAKMKAWPKYGEIAKAQAAQLAAPMPALKPEPKKPEPVAAEPVAADEFDDFMAETGAPPEDDGLPF